MPTSASSNAKAVVERLRMSLWFIPAVAVVASIALAAGTLALDHALGLDGKLWFFIAFGHDSARNVLSTVAATMATSISLIFSVTIVVLQLGSAQYSPRVLRTFIRDRFVQTVLAAYIGTFVYSLIILPAVRAPGAEDPGLVPTISVLVSLTAALGSLALFVRYIHHIAHSIRAITIIGSVAEETRESIDRLYPEELGEEGEQDAPPPDERFEVVVHQGDPGVVVGIDDAALMKLASDRSAVLRIVPKVGDFVPYRAPIVHVWHGDAPIEEQALADCLVIAAERTMQQDSAFGLRQLVDIAARALSPGTNDPTTAIQALDHLHDLLRRLATRRFPSPVRLDEGGEVRVFAPRLDWAGYVTLAFDEIRIYGGNALQVTRRMQDALADLLSVAPASRHGPLRRQQNLLEATIREHFDEPQERDLARDPSRAS